RPQIPRRGAEGKAGDLPPRKGRFCGRPRLRPLPPRPRRGLRRPCRRRRAGIDGDRRPRFPRRGGQVAEPDREVGEVSAERMDPILLEVLWNRLVSVVEEQARALMRTSFTSVVREAGDLSAALFDRRGRMVAQAVTGTPGHINSLAVAAVNILDEYPPDALQPG